MDPDLLGGATDDDILRNYLDLVRAWRGTTPRAALRLRKADVAVLVSILGTNDAEIERRLVAATACTPKAARQGRLLLLASLGVLALGWPGTTIAGASTHATPVTSSAALRPVAAATDPPAPVPDPTVPVTTAPTPVTTEPTPVTTAPTPVTTEPTPVTTAPTPVTTAPTQTTPSTMAPAAVVVAGSKATPSRPIRPVTTEPVALPTAVFPAGTTATVSIPTLGIDLPIVDGDQSVIDRGVVAHYVADGWEPPVAAGAPGTYWLAAHHLSHGAPFGRLPDIAVGAEIRVMAGGRTFVYTVTSTEVVGLLPGDGAVYGADPAAAVILLQTCVDETRRLLVHGTLTWAG